MDKRLVQAVAGSGKTSYILENLCLDKRSLIVTYTNENFRNLEKGIEEKFGCMPQNITLMTYFSFLGSFCFQPYLGYQLRNLGFSYENPPAWTGRLKQNEDIRHYISTGRYLYHNRAAKLIIKTETDKKVVSRIEKYFDNFFIDEVQDFAANDFNLLISLSDANVNMLFVGDFYQHTYDTSRDGNVRRSLHAEYNNYLSEFEKSGFYIDTKTLTKSYRCSSDVCEFISINLGIAIQSHRDDSTNVALVEDKGIADELFVDDSVVKLFYNNQSRYNCHSNNWGKSKGMDSYDSVCVVLTKSAFDLYKRNMLVELPPSSKNGLYVACTRARGDLCFVSVDLFDGHKH